MKVTDDPKSVKLIVRLIDATVILHNMLIELGEEEKEDWIDYDDFSDHDDELRAPFRDNDVLNRSIAAVAPKDTCRKQLLPCFKENVFHQIRTRSPEVVYRFTFRPSYDDDEDW